MDNTKGDEYYIKKIIENINMIISYSSGLSGIVHEYGNTDYAIVYEIVTSDIHDLKRVLLSENKNI